MNNNDDIMERLNVLMENRGLSLRAVEKLTNVPFSTVGRLKRGENVSDGARERVRCFLDGEPYSAPHKELSEHMADISALFAAKDARIAELEAEVERLRPRAALCEQAWQDVVITGEVDSTTEKAIVAHFEEPTP